MSEYELADYTNSLLDTFLTAFTIFMSVVTAYIITAFVAGDRLTSSQLGIVNLVFSVATGIMGLLAFLVFQRFYLHAVIVQTPVGEAVGTPVNFSWPLVVLMVVLVGGSFTFMWSIRRNSNSNG